MISVAMTTYNGAQYIIEQLDSIRLQTRKVDDYVREISLFCVIKMTVGLIAKWKKCVVF